MGLSGFIKMLKEEINITDLISSYIPIQKSGKNYKARCPFHEERTASFYIYESTQSYHCFGCGANGDIIKFVQEYEGVEFKEAVEKLARQYNLQPPSFDSSTDQKYMNYTRDMHLIEDVFGKNLVMGTPAWDYLQKERNLNPEKLKHIGAGYATYRDIKELTGVLDKKRLKELGILTDSGTSLFVNRLILPIRDGYGRTIAFSGRKLSNDKSSPKYVNSPQTNYFNKSKILYLLDKSKNDIKEVDFAIIVEGYFDALRLYLNGIRNVVAVMGTALTKEHLRELGKYTRKLVFSFDNDKAGINAIGKSYEQLGERFNTLVLNLDPVKDPDEFVEKYGIEGFQNTLLKAISIEEHLLTQMKSHYNLDKDTGKDSLIKESRDILARTKRAGNISRFDKLISMLSNWTGLDKKLLLDSWNVTQKKTAQKKFEANNNSMPQQSRNVKQRQTPARLRKIAPEEELMILYLFHPTTRKMIEEVFEEYGMIMQKAYSSFFSDVRKKFKPDDAAEYLKDYFEKEQIDYFVCQIERYEDPDTFPTLISDYKTALRGRKLKRELAELDEEIKNASGTDIKGLFKKRHEIAIILHNLNRERKEDIDERK